MTQNIYGIVPAATETYTGAAGSLPGAAAMSVAALVKMLSVDPAVDLIFGNLTGGNSGWQMVISPIAVATGGNAMSIVVKTNAWTATVVVGATFDAWMLVGFTVSGTTLTIYVNGEAVFTTTNVAVVVTPQVAAPTLVIPNSAILSAAFYTEQALTAAQMSAAGLVAKNYPFVSEVANNVDHLYSAPESLRPVPSATAPFADTGSVGGVPLTPDVQAFGIVQPGDFGQPVVPAITTGILTAPTAA